MEMFYTEFTISIAVPSEFLYVTVESSEMKLFYPRLSYPESYIWDL